jgi:hypothetical protein
VVMVSSPIASALFRATYVPTKPIVEPIICAGRILQNGRRDRPVSGASYSLN